MKGRAIILSLLFVATNILIFTESLFRQPMCPPDPLTRQEGEKFLRTAHVVSVRSLSQGVTLSQRATLTDGKITHDAHIQTVNIRKHVFKTLSGTEYYFDKATSEKGEQLVLFDSASAGMTAVRAGGLAESIGKQSNARLR